MPAFSEDCVLACVLLLLEMKTVYDVINYAILFCDQICDSEQKIGKMEDWNMLSTQAEKYILYSVTGNFLFGKADRLFSWAVLSEV